MGRISNPLDMERISNNNQNMGIASFKCPHCTDNEGNFADIVLFIPEEENLASQGICSGQESQCCVLLDFMQSYNCERMLQSQTNE